MSELMLSILGIALIAGIGTAGVIYGSDSASLGTDKAVQLQTINDTELYKGALISCRMENLCTLDGEYSIEYLVEHNFIDSKYLTRTMVREEKSNVTGEYQ